MYHIRMIITAISVVVCNVMALAVEPDTVLIINDVRNLTITERPDGFKVYVKNSDGDSVSTLAYAQDFKYAMTIKSQQIWPISLKFNDRPKNHKNGRSRSHWECVMEGPGIGWVNACDAPESLGLEMGKSLEISWLNALAVNYVMPSLRGKISIGLGFDWRNYKISTSNQRLIVSDGVVGVSPYPSDVIPSNSRLKVFSLGVPVLYTQSFGTGKYGSKTQLRLGAVFNYNSHASIKSFWTDMSGSNVTEYSGDVGQRKFSVDFIAVFRVYGIGLYVRYSPMSVLSGAGQPQFHPFSTGLMLF